MLPISCRLVWWSCIGIEARAVNSNLFLHALDCWASTPGEQAKLFYFAEYSAVEGSENPVLKSKPGPAILKTLTKKQLQQTSNSYPLTYFMKERIPRQEVGF